jgi:hypothetical protein
MMSMKSTITYAIPLSASLLFAGAAVAQQQSLPDLSGWHEAAQKAAKAMNEKYGAPDGVTDTMLVWNDTGPWKQTIVYKEAVQHDFPMPHPDVLEQTINYDVPVDMFDDLAAYDGSVIAERTKGILSARCDKEAANFLAINLANDIVTGQRTVEEAREYYAETIKAVMNGEKPEYTQGFVFDVPQENVNNPDEAVMQKS